MGMRRALLDAICGASDPGLRGRIRMRRIALESVDAGGRGGPGRAPHPPPPPLSQALPRPAPALWPALMHYFQAALAYQRQTEERDTAAGSGQAGAPPASSSLGPPPMPSGPASPNPSFSRNTAPAQPVAPAERAVAQ